MIHKVEMYAVKCDNCGTVHEDRHLGFVAWTSFDSALDMANDSGWITKTGSGLSEADQHFCPDCAALDNDLEQLDC